jgi:RimJ/RimL family protein N-acetyltransferase
MDPPAYRIVTPRLVLRCWQPADAPLLAEAVSASLDHLRPWMPWAQAEPLDLPARVRLLRNFRAAFDGDRDYIYGMFTPDEAEVVGGTGLHPRAGEGMREIGYWIRVDRVRRGYATEAAAALTKVAFEVDRVRRVEIRCDPRNLTSAGVAERLGFAHEGTLADQAMDGDGTPRATMVWAMTCSRYEGSPCASAAVSAYDVVGAPLL